jgi:hypothetical protein
LGLFLLANFGLAQDKPTHAPKAETPHIRFFKEFLREIVQDEDLTKSSEKELAEDKTINEKLSTGIYYSKSVQLELQSQIAMLKGMRLNEPFDILIPTLVASYQRQIGLHQQLIDISSKFLGGPKEGVDYQALGAKMPEIRAELDDVRKLIFESAAPIFMTLIDMRPDSQGHVSHLIITKADRADLMEQLNSMLKDESEKGDHDYYVSAAMVLRDAFQKGHKCSDEPWE